jgi:hypothetical protein
MWISDHRKMVKMNRSIRTFRELTRFTTVKNRDLLDLTTEKYDIFNSPDDVNDSDIGKRTPALKTYKLFIFPLYITTPPLFCF